MMPPVTPQRTTRMFFLTLVVIHFGLLIGQLLFGMVAYYLASTEGFGESSVELNQMLQVIVPLSAIGVVVGSSFLFKNQLNALNQKEHLRDKLTNYQTAQIIKYGLIEGVSLLAIVSFMLTANTLFMGIAAALILLFVIQRPTLAKAIADMELSQEDREILENPDAIIED